ncbi:acyl-CoA dehydrogenase [Pararhodobacter zhoushanensis]|uniref:Acyl-CoA dehydrogenase family protein n=1 Tax=Pararhodobacter zhoushanensis TaxID=2479545 RepID=A0ABT3GT81_9RHOB|nr:acyl-CoA dehydrogenase family protein [Pararhodobacter zhoushanensis]MCW1930749.1 acyl-CoA dehydrogenase family protein [Pararhodobacter zhoushanensis]
MRLIPGDEERMLRDSARRLLAGGASWADFAEQGWLALPVPEAFGGLGGAASTVAVLAEEMGRARVVERWVAGAVLPAVLIDALASEAQKARWLPAMAEGTLRVAFAHVERGDGLLSVATRWDGALTGAKAAVFDGDKAGLLLVTAQTPAGLGLFAVAPAGLTPYATVDGGIAADLVLDSTPGEVLGDPAVDASPGLLQALDHANAAACSEAVGAMAALLEATVSYTKERVQFGQPLAKFQALRHRMAEMAVKLEEARASALLAALSLGMEPLERARGVSGARAKIGKLSRSVAQEAIQLHGAMGFSEEMPVGGWFKRLYALENTWGATAFHLQRYGEALRDPALREQGLLRAGADDGGMNLALSKDDLAFRDEVRAFFDATLDADTKRAERLNPSFLAHPPIGLSWLQKLPAGWAAPSWPAEHGGSGWTLTQRYLFDQESERAGEPHFRGASFKMIAPVLMRYGTPAQQARYLPRILNGQDFWAQGYSEPGSGSDLASLSCKAVRDGDSYVVNGSKIWSTHAHHATRMFALVRTDDSGKKQQGISFLLIDMNAPGVSVKPIRSICGTHEFNQTFFDAVRVPASDLVGAEGDGWEIAKYLLEFERGGAFAGGLLRALYARLWRMAEASGLTDDPLFMARFAEIGTDIDANDMLELTAMSAVQAGGNPGAVPSSVMKIERSRIRQAITELGAYSLGPDALRWEPHRPLHDLPVEEELAEDRKVASAVYINARSQSIFGGSNEIQLEIIARVLLG